MIKKLLFILPLLFLLLHQETKVEVEKALLSFQQERMTKDSETANPAHDIIQNDELSCYHNTAFCTPNRSIQTFSENSERLFKITTKQFELFLQKGQNQLNKISEILSVTYSLNYSSLRIRSGHWVYVLRKIII
jgi:hypothetical protein